jgi:leucyl aminopeptidase
MIDKPMKVNFVDTTLPESGVVVVIVSQKEAMDPFTKALDQICEGALQRCIESDHFTPSTGTIVSLPYPVKKIPQVLVVGFSENKNLTPLKVEELGGKIWSALAKCQEKNVTVYLPTSIQIENSSNQAAARLANGMLLKSWQFAKYKTRVEKTDHCQIKNLNICTDNPKKTKEDFTPLAHIAEGIFLTRHVVSEPPNVIYPESLAKIAKDLEDIGIKVEVLGEKEMKKLGMNALLGVGQGSIRESQLVVLHWQGGKKNEAPVAFVGKGVTFDTGGISIKPSQDMDEMKWDMGGAGVVLGLMKALAMRHAKVNAIGVMGLVENMPSGSAQRPGDIVTSMSGQTIEILNTDAEGRLVLADALWYAQDRFKPKFMIDLATLTGAIIISLGHEHAGLFSNDEDLAQKIIECGGKTGEKVWRLPLSDAYDREIDSPIADVKNLGSGRGAGSITAAQFLQRFVNKVPWAHLDIAGTTWEKKDRSLNQKGATAFGVRLLNQLIEDHFEK